MPSVYSLYSLLVVSFFTVSIVAEKQCYALNGTQLGDEYGPCDPTAEHSGCCAIHRPAGSAELCLSGGLCMATSNEYIGTIWQSGCTDPFGMDPSCPNVCSDGPDKLHNVLKVPAWNIQTCDFGSYCCRAAGDRTNCCNNSTSQRITTKALAALQTDQTATPSSTTSSASATSSVSAPASTATQIAAMTTPSSSSLNESTSCAAEKRQTVIVGGTLAGIFSAAIVGLLACIFFLFSKEQKQRKLKEHYEEQFATSSWGRYKSEMGSKTTVTASDGERVFTEKDVEVRYIGRRDT